MAAVHGALNKPETFAEIREKIRAELPTLLKFYRADAYLMKKVAASAAAFSRTSNQPGAPASRRNRSAGYFAD